MLRAVLDDPFDVETRSMGNTMVPLRLGSVLSSAEAGRGKVQGGCNFNTCKL